jgi:uncharacterized protein
MTVPDGTTRIQPSIGGPAAPRSRQQLPDRLRGFALLGIVLVNVPFLGISSGGTTPESVGTPVDRVVAGAVVALAQGKFYLLFSFLFGYGLTLMLRHLDAEGLRRYRRRLAALAVLGLLHGVFFFLGDILLSYAILGTGLLLLVRRPDRAVLWWAAISYAVAVVALALIVVAAVLVPTDDTTVLGGSAALDDAVLGSFLDGARGRADTLGGVLLFLAVLNWGQAFAMFCLGLVAGRRGLLAEPERHRDLWRRLLWLAALVGLPCGIVAGVLAYGPGSPSPVRDAVSAALSFGAAPALTAGYVALFALGSRSRRLGAFARAGRMSLTIYLGESILLSAVFAGWGFGLLGRYGAATTTLVGVVVWLVLELFAASWLRRFRFGPFEWLLRAWTYRTRSPGTSPPR